MKDLTKDKKILIIGAIVVVLVIVLLVLFVFNKGSKDENNTNVENNTTENTTKITADDLEKAYGFSGEDAIKLVKQSFNGDTFNFSYEVSEDSKYIVIAKSIFEDDDTVFKFEVDPVTKSYYSLD